MDEQKDLSANESPATDGGATKDVALLHDRQGLEVISYDECLELLRHGSLGRVGFVDAGEMVILPVNYAYISGSILFRTTTGSKLHNAMMERPMSFEIDDWDKETRTGWSVLLKGVSDEVTDAWIVALSEQLGVEPWATEVPREDCVRIRADEITGRRIIQQ